jgi:hypothetical protein
MNTWSLCAVLSISTLSFLCAGPTQPESEKPLGKIDTFAMGGIGVVGSMSRGERALRQILKESDAVLRLETMIPDATPAGKLYALLGLRARDRAAYARALEICRATDTEVSTARGCIVSRESFSDLVKQIDRGRYDAGLAREWPENRR